ncbi:MAG: winged helix DNA-binding domain-containing protein, partial [Chloroflexota bacterium]
LAEAARPFLLDEPRTTGELRDFLLTIDPDGEPNAMAYAVRTHLPLVQVPPAGTWGAGTRASYTVADNFITSDAQASDLETLFRRYLRAYGPASIMDFQTWVGMTRLTKPLNAIKAQFTLYESESGEVLFDLPEMSIIEADTPVPVRFIPEYDNILIAHRDRTRILADDDYSKVFLSAARVLSTFLVDGVVAGTWKINRNKAKAELVISPFRENDISSDTRDALVAEGEALLRFVEADADDYSVRFGAEERT